MNLRKTLIGASIATAMSTSSAFAETDIGGYGELHYNNLIQI